MMNPITLGSAQLLAHLLLMAVMAYIVIETVDSIVTDIFSSIQLTPTAVTAGVALSAALLFAGLYAASLVYGLVTGLDAVGTLKFAITGAQDALTAAVF